MKEIKKKRIEEERQYKSMFINQKLKESLDKSKSKLNFIKVKPFLFKYIHHLSWIKNKLKNNLSWTKQTLFII